MRALLGVGPVPQFFADGTVFLGHEPPFSLGAGDLGGVTFFLNPVASFQKFSQPVERALPISYLRPAFGGLGDEAGGKVADTHS